MDTHPRFVDSKSADVVLRYYSWDHIYLVQPEYREDGFLILINRDTLNAVFDQLHIQRNLAVVAIGWSYDEPQLMELAQEWTRALRGLGFKNVVAVRATGKRNEAEGALIIEDTRRTTAQPRISAAF